MRRTVLTRLRRTPICLALILLLAGCGTADRAVAQLPPGEARTVAAGVGTFGFNLLGQVTDGRQNAVVSPVSAAALLGLVMAGADGQTADAMARVLHTDGPRDARVGALLNEVTDTDDVTLSVGNAIWGDTGTDFRDDYVDYVHRTFGARITEADLADQVSADQIDAWVRDQTEGRIPAIAKDLQLPSPLAVAALVNAVYFLGDWQTSFDPAWTRDDPFTLPNGRTVDVPMMHQRDVRYAYTARDGYAVLRLPYGKSGQYGMTVWLPDENSDLPALLQRLRPAEREAALRAMRPTEITELGLPRFELKWGKKLNDPLTALGMGVAFGPGADFSRMAPNASHLSVVFQKTYIRVDEKGTEAAAVTGGVVVESARPDAISFVVDRPFLFTITDSKTGADLFLGTVVDPRG